MKATSIHLKACDIGSAEAHNKREKELDYIRKDLSELNESFSYIDKPLPAIEADIRREVKAKTGRKLQKNAIPIKEGVIVIDENTTLKDLQNFCEECRTKFGMIPLSIDIHRDEGYMNSKDWKRNLHAHIIWRMYDENGRNVRLSKQDMSDMQTMAAQHLHMARGKSSDKKHLSSIQYKIKAETERLQSIENAIEMAENKLSKKGAKGVYNAIRDHLAGDMKKELEKTRATLEMANKTILEQSQTIETMERDNNARNDTNARLLDKLNKQTEDIRNIESIRAEKNQAIRDYERKARELQNEYQSKEIDLQHRENSLTRKEDAIKSREKEAEEFYKDAEQLGLTCQQANQLKRDGSLRVPGIILPDGTTIQRDDPNNPNIEIKYGNFKPDRWSDKVVKCIHLYFSLDWKSVKSWVRDVMHSPWFRINGISNDRRNSQRMGY